MDDADKALWRHLQAETGEWTWEVVPTSDGKTFNWEVKVYLNNVQVGNDWLWLRSSARRAAKRIRRKWMKAKRREVFQAGERKPL